MKIKRADNKYTLVEIVNTFKFFKATLSRIIIPQQKIQNRPQIIDASSIENKLFEKWNVEKSYVRASDLQKNNLTIIIEINFGRYICRATLSCEMNVGSASCDFLANFAFPKHDKSNRKSKMKYIATWFRFEILMGRQIATEKIVQKSRPAQSPELNNDAAV